MRKCEEIGRFKETFEKIYESTFLKKLTKILEKFVDIFEKVRRVNVLKKIFTVGFSENFKNSYIFLGNILLTFSEKFVNIFVKVCIHLRKNYMVFEKIYGHLAKNAHIEKIYKNIRKKL